MSNQQNSTSKSPYQSRRGTPRSHSNDTSLLNRQTPCNPPSQSSATRPTQKDKQTAQSTPTKGLASAPRDNTNNPPGNTSRPLFNPTVSSTPRSSQIRDRPTQPSPSTPLRIGLELSRTYPAQATMPAATYPSCPPCPPCPLICPPCPRDGTLQSMYPISNDTDSARQMCFCPVPTWSATCAPRKPATSGVTAGAGAREPREPADRPPSIGPSLVSGKGPEGVKKERLLKLEILAISGGTLYDLDKIHTHSPTRTPTKTEPKYDPCFDVDRIPLTPATVVSECDLETMETDRSEDLCATEKERKSTLVQEEGDGLVEPRGSEDETSFVRDDTLSKTDDTSFVVPAAPRKKKFTKSDDGEYDIVRSAPAVLAAHNLSELSLSEVPPIGEEGGHEAATFRSAQPPGLGDDYVPIGDVSVPLPDSGFLEIPDVIETNVGERGREDGKEATERKDGTKTSDKASATVGGTIPPEQTANEQIVADEGRGSISLILGPSVRNFAHLAMSPLISLRTLLGPTPNARPARLKRIRQISDDLGHPDCRMRSIRSAFMITPYEAAASSLGCFLRRQIRRSRKTSPAPESSSEDQ